MKFKELTNETEILNIIRWHNENSKYLVFDIETTGLNPFTDTITDIIIHGDGTFDAYLFNGSFAATLKMVCIPFVAHNFRFDFNFLYRNGVDLRLAGLHHDTMLLDHLLDENKEHSLDSIVQRRYKDDYKEQFWANIKGFAEAPRQAQVEYACKDVVYTKKVYEDTISDLSRAGIPDSLIEHVRSLALALYDTEIQGVAIDLPYLQDMAETLQNTIAGLKKTMRGLVELDCYSLEMTNYIERINERKTEKGKAAVKLEEFSFDSPKQLGVLLYDQLKLPVQINKQRKRTVDDGALEKLEETKLPLISYIRQYRGNQKTYTSFIEGTLEKMQNGNIYPSFNVNGTVTGRISSSNPNMQQLPKEGGVRGIYIPSPGHKFISCDYSQLEVTLAAHFSQDENLLKIVHEGASQHDITAKGLGIDRHTAKTINFAMQYGAGLKKIQSILGTTEKEAQTALDKYWETYKGLSVFIKNCHAAVERGHPLVNPFGRQRHFPAVFEDKWALERAKRQAANSLIQGTGADITNMAFHLIAKNLIKFDWGRALFPIHDEILIEVKNNITKSATNLLQNKMIDIGKSINLSVPLSVDYSKPMERWSK